MLRFILMLVLAILATSPTAYAQTNPFAAQIAQIQAEKERNDRDIEQLKADIARVEREREELHADNKATTAEIEKLNTAIAKIDRLEGEKANKLAEIVELSNRLKPPTNLTPQQEIDILEQLRTMFETMDRKQTEIEEILKEAGAPTATTAEEEYLQDHATNIAQLEARLKHVREMRTHADAMPGAAKLKENLRLTETRLSDYLNLIKDQAALASGLTALAKKVDDGQATDEEKADLKRRLDKMQANLKSMQQYTSEI